MAANSVHGVVEIIKVLREESRRSVKKEITAYDIFEYVSSEIPLFGKTVPIIAVKAKDGLPVPDGEKYSVPWVLDNQYPNCMRCNCAFTVFGRRHHCRACGYLVCKNCTTAVASGEFIEAVKVDSRICNYCQSNKGRRSTFDASLHASPVLLEADPAESTKSGIMVDAPESSPERATEMNGSSSSAPVVINNNTTTIVHENVVHSHAASSTINNNENSTMIVLSAGDMEQAQHELAQKVAALDAQKAEQAKLLEELHGLRAKLTHRKQMVLESMEKIANLEGIVAAQGSELGTLREQLDNVKLGVSPEKGVSALKREIELLQAALEAKDAELESNQQQLKDREAEMRELSAAMHQAQADLQRQQSTHEAALQALQQQIRVLSEALDERTATLAQQEAQYAQQDAQQVKQLREQSETMRRVAKENEQLAQEIRRLTTELHASQSDVTQGTRRATDLEAQLQRAQETQQEERRRLLADVSALQDAQSTQTATLLARDLEVKRLQEENQRLRDDGERHRQMMGLATDEQLTQLTSELAARDALLTKAQVTLASREAELATLKAESVRSKAAFMAEAEAQAAQLIANAGAVTQLQITLAARDAEVRNWREEYDATSKRLQALTQEHTAVTAAQTADLQRLRDALAQKTAECD
eukprot:gene16042-11481_t